MAVDSCVIIDLLTGNEPDLQETARHIFRQHAERHRVVLPAIVIPEIAGCGAVNADTGGVDARAARVLKVHHWIRDSGYLVADLTERIARQAAKLATDHKLKGADASVLATAVAWECSMLYTRDHSLLRIDGKLPRLRICSSDAHQYRP